MLVRLIFMKLIDRVKMLFFLNNIKLIMIYFQILRKNIDLQEILEYQYINRNGNGVA